MLKLILNILIIIHILIWLFIVFGGFKSAEYSKFIIFIIIPCIYVLHILPFHILETYELEIINKNKINNNTDNNTGKSSNEILIENKNKYIIPYIHSTLSEKLFNKSFGNPLSPQGLLILGYIINVYLLKYKWKEWI